MSQFGQEDGARSTYRASLLRPSASWQRTRTALWTRNPRWRQLSADVARLNRLPALEILREFVALASRSLREPANKALHLGTGGGAAVRNRRAKDCSNGAASACLIRRRTSGLRPIARPAVDRRLDHLVIMAEAQHPAGTMSFSFITSSQTFHCNQGARLRASS